MTEDVNGEMCGNMHAFEGKSQVETAIKKIILVDKKKTDKVTRYFDSPL